MSPPKKHWRLDKWQVASQVGVVYRDRTQKLKSTTSVLLIDHTIHTYRLWDSSKPQRPNTLSQKNQMAPKARTCRSRVGPNWDHHRPSRCRHSYFFKIILPFTMRDMKLVTYYITNFALFSILTKFIWNHLHFFPVVLCCYVWFLYFCWIMSSPL